jgi:hypothetical protein
VHETHTQEAEAEGEAEGEVEEEGEDGTKVMNTTSQGEGLKR